MDNTARESADRVAAAVDLALRTAVELEFERVAAEHKNRSAELQQKLSAAQSGAADAKEQVKAMAQKSDADAIKLAELQARAAKLELEKQSARGQQAGAVHEQRAASLEASLKRALRENFALRGALLERERCLQVIVDDLERVPTQYRAQRGEEKTALEGLLRFCARLQGVARIEEDVEERRSRVATGLAQDIGEAVPDCGDEASQAIECNKALPFRPPAGNDGSKRPPLYGQKGKEDHGENRTKEQSSGGGAAKRRNGAIGRKMSNGASGSKLSLKTRSNLCSPSAGHRGRDTIGASLSQSSSSSSSGVSSVSSASSTGGGGNITSRSAACLDEEEPKGCHEMSVVRNDQMKEVLQINGDSDDAGVGRKCPKSSSGGCKMWLDDQQEDMARNAGSESGQKCCFSGCLESTIGKAAMASGFSGRDCVDGKGVANMNDSGSSREEMNMDTTTEGDDPDHNTLNGDAQDDIIEETCCNAESMAESVVLTVQPHKSSHNCVKETTFAPTVRKVESPGQKGGSGRQWHCWNDDAIDSGVQMGSKAESGGFSETSSRMKEHRMAQEKASTRERYTSGTRNEFRDQDKDIETDRQAGSDVEGDESPVLESKRRKRAREGRVERSRCKEQSNNQIVVGMQDCVKRGGEEAGHSHLNFLSRPDASGMKVDGSLLECEGNHQVWAMAGGLVAVSARQDCGKISFSGHIREEDKDRKRARPHQDCSRRADPGKVAARNALRKEDETKELDETAGRESGRLDGRMVIMEEEAAQENQFIDGILADKGWAGGRERAEKAAQAQEKALAKSSKSEGRTVNGADHKDRLHDGNRHVSHGAAKLKAPDRVFGSGAMSRSSSIAAFSGNLKAPDRVNGGALYHASTAGGALGAGGTGMSRSESAGPTAERVRDRANGGNGLVRSATLPMNRSGTVTAGLQRCNSLFLACVPEDEAVGTRTEAALRDGRDIRRSDSRGQSRKPLRQVSTMKVNEVVRNKEDREAMKASACDQCNQFYASAAYMTNGAVGTGKTCNHVSRHRHNHTPPSTPEHYWDVGWNSTQGSTGEG